MIKRAFSFGSQINEVEQKDKSPKKVFVFGVYAIAVQYSSADFNP